MHRLLIMAVALVFLSSALGVAQALAHAGEEIIPVRLAVTEWASALQSDDERVMAGLLSDRFPGKAQYIASLPLTPITRVDLSHATLDIQGDTATFTPVVIFPRVNMLNPEALSLTLERDAQQWKIVEIAPTTDIPDESKISDHVLQHVVHDVTVSLLDADSGEPAHARIHVNDASGDYWPPQGHAKKITQGWREDIGGDVIIEGKVFAYVSPRFTLQLPEGRYEIEVERGPEYEPERRAFDVRAGKVPSLEIR